jgi:hypothetical protein
MRAARGAAVETLSPHFRLLDLEGEALRNVAWTAGQKGPGIDGLGPDRADLHAGRDPN